MAHTSEYERIYIGSSTPSGLSFRDEVRAALGTTVSHVGMLCMDVDDQGNDAGRINPNSVRKPSSGGSPEYTTVDPGYFPIRRFGQTYNSNYNIYP